MTIAGVIPVLLEAAVRSLVLGVLVGLMFRIARVRDPYLEKTAWTVVLCAAAAMPLLLAMRLHGPVIGAPLRVLSGAVIVRPTLAGAAVSHAMEWIIVVSYAATAIALLTRYASGLARMMRIRRSARVVREHWTDGLDVRATDELASPATFGSTVLLPESYVQWNDRMRAAIISHERAHVIGRDCHRLWLARLYRCLFWFNPLGWWLERRLASLAEATSDAAALRALGDRPAYAQILLAFAARGGLPSRVVMGMTRRSIAARIEHILAGGSPPAEPRMPRRVLACASILPAVLALATLQLAPMHSARAQLAAGTQADAGGRAAGGPAQADGGPAQPGGDAQNGAGADRATPAAPRVLRWPSDLMDFYPAQARRAGIEGFVDIAVTLDAAGRATDTQILTEFPLGVGFGAAASAAAHEITYSNPTGRPAQLVFRIKFALAKGDRDGSTPDGASTGGAPTDSAPTGG